MLRRPAVLFAVLAVLAAPAVRAQVPAALADAVRAQGAPNAAGLAGAAADLLGGETRLVAADGVAQDRFGFSVAVSGTHALVGAYRRESGRGVAYAFEFENGAWVPKNTLRPGDGAAGHQFGWAVAISGDRALVTAPGVAAAYAYVWTGAAWAQRGRLVPPAPLVVDYGLSVAMAGDRAIVGASYSSTTPGTATGAAFVYAASGSSWVLQQQLGAGQAVPGDNFGYAVAISGDRALVGAYRADSERGAVFPYVYNGTSWTAQARFRGAEITLGDRFGIAIALDGDRALVGADESGVGGNAGGAAFVFEWTGSQWAQRERLIALDRPPNYADRWDERFGASVALSGDLALVGAQYARVDPTDITSPVERGAAYLFEYDGEWDGGVKLTASDWTANDRFGSAVAVSGEAALVGAWAKNASRGAAYVYGVATPLELVVNSVGDDGEVAIGDDVCDTGGTVVVAGQAVPECTLRAAIQTSNARGGGRITFDIETQGVPLIAPESGLPAIDVAVEIDATSQAGGVVHLAGQDAGETDGLLISGADEVLVRGLSVTGFTGWGLHFDGGAGHVVERNSVGFLPGAAGFLAPNGLGGILVENGATDVTVGSEDQDGSNRVYGGVVVQGDATRGVAVLRNEMAVDVLEAGITTVPLDLADGGPSCVSWEPAGEGPNGGMAAPRLLSISATAVAGRTRPGARVVVYRTAGTLLGIGTARGRYWPAWVRPVGFAVADGDGAFSVALDEPLADGDYVTATATDDAGNTSELAQLKRPVIFLPGIGGSWLESAVNGDNIWLPTDLQPWETRNDLLARLAMDPTGQSIEALNVDGIVEIGAFGYGIAYYDALEAITAAGYPGDIGNDDRATNDLWRFPYDWRPTTLEIATQLKSLVDELTGGNGDVAVSCEVDLVAHSMGGIVSNDYVRIEENHARDHVHRYLTIATPYLGASKAAQAHATGYVFDVEETALAFEVEWGRMVTMARNVPAIYGLMPSRAFWQAMNTDSPSHAHGFLFQDLDGAPLRSYEETVAFLAAPKRDPNGQPLGLGRNGDLIASQQTDVHDRIDDWREWDGPPHVFRQVGIVPGRTVTGFKLGVNMVEPFGLDLPAGSTPREELGDTDRHHGWRAMIQPILGTGDETVPLVSATLGANPGVGVVDFSGVDRPWIEPFDYYPCSHTGIIADACESQLGGSALSRVQEILRSGYQVVPAPTARPSMDGGASSGAEVLYVTASGPVTVTVEDSQGNRTGPASREDYRRILYGVPDIGYWQGEYTVTVSVPQGSAYSVVVDAPAEAVTARVYRMQAAEPDVTRRNVLFADQPLAAAGQLRLTLAADGTPETTPLAVDADGDGTFEGTLTPSAVLTGTVGYPAVPTPEPTAIDARATGESPITVEMMLPDVGAAGWTWALAESAEWITPSSVAGSVPATITLDLAADAVSDTLSTASMVLTLRYGTYAVDVEVPVALRIGEGTVGTEPPGTSVPDALSLSAAHPNPARGSATVEVQLPSASRARVVVNDVLGREVAVLADGEMEAGRHAMGFDASRLAPGVYVILLRVGNEVRTSRMTVIR